jgi:hypothetical protein
MDSLQERFDAEDRLLCALGRVTDAELDFAIQRAGVNLWAAAFRILEYTALEDVCRRLPPCTKTALEAARLALPRQRRAAVLNAGRVAIDSLPFV